MILHFLVLHCTTNGVIGIFYMFIIALQVIPNILNPILARFWPLRKSRNPGTFRVPESRFSFYPNEVCCQKDPPYLKEHVCKVSGRWFTVHIIKFSKNCLEGGADRFFWRFFFEGYADARYWKMLVVDKGGPISKREMVIVFSPYALFFQVYRQ